MAEDANIVWFKEEDGRPGLIMNAYLYFNDDAARERFTDSIKQLMTSEKGIKWTR